MATKKKTTPVVEKAQEVDPEILYAVEPEPAFLDKPDTEQPEITDETLLEVWDRRFVNPGARSATPVRLKIKGMVVRWINTAIEGRYHRAVYDQGWKPVPVAMLADPESIPDLFKHPHNIVARGERGKEVLMMMPAKVYARIEKRKAELNQASLRKLRTELAQAAGSKLGPEAGDFAQRGGTEDGMIKTIGTVRFGTERVPMGEAE